MEKLSLVGIDIDANALNYIMDELFNICQVLLVSYEFIPGENMNRPVNVLPIRDADPTEVLIRFINYCKKMNYQGISCLRFGDVAAAHNL